MLYSRLPSTRSEHGHAHVVEAMRAWATRPPAGVTVNLEVVNRYESNVVNTAGRGWG